MSAAATLHVQGTEITATAETMITYLRHRGYVVLSPRDGLDAGDLRLWPRWRRADWRGRAVALTRREAEVLAVLMGRHPIPVPGPVIDADLGGPFWHPPDRLTSNAARFHVCALRRKFGPGLIVTTRAGYALRPGGGA